MYDYRYLIVYFKQQSVIIKLNKLYTIFSDAEEIKEDSI